MISLQRRVSLRAYAIISIVLWLHGQHWCRTDPLSACIIHNSIFTQPPFWNKWLLSNGSGLNILTLRQTECQSKAGAHFARSNINSLINITIFMHKQIIKPIKLVVSYRFHICSLNKLIVPQKRLSNDDGKIMVYQKMPQYLMISRTCSVFNQTSSCFNDVQHCSFPRPRPTLIPL